MAKDSIPMDFVERPGADANMDGRTPITAGPEVPAQLATDPNFNAHVESEVARRVQSNETKHVAALAAAGADGQRTAALATLGAMIEGNPGDTVDALKFRGAVQDMVLAIHAGSDKPPAEYVGEAMRLNEARIQQIAAQGGDGAQARPEVMDRAPDGGSALFSLPRFMTGLSAEVARMGDRFDYTEMTGGPEIDYVKSMLGGNDRLQQQFGALQNDAGQRGRVIPVPLSAFNDLPAQFAETYGTGPDTRREPTYRRDALVGFQRPDDVLTMLGAPQPTIDNDITMPRLSASIVAVWRAENAAAADDDLTVAVFTTAPHRLTARSSLSWMLLAGGDAQFGHQPKVLDEMSRAIMSARESAVYNGASSGEDPTGLRNFSGITTTDLGTTAPTYADLLNAYKRITDHNIDVSSAAWAINWTMATLLWQIRRFATGSATLLNEASFMAPGAGPMNAGMYGAAAGMMPGGKMAAVTNHLPVASGGDTDMICGVWDYVWCIDYGTAFLTIDDISQANTGQTRITTNTYHEVAVRWADAFEIVRYDSIT